MVGSGDVSTEVATDEDCVRLKSLGRESASVVDAAVPHSSVEFSVPA